MKSGIRLKVCGMKEAENIRQVGALHPDYMGFIFYDVSPRYVGKDFNLPVELDSSIHRVGVFVNQPASFIRETVNRYHLQFAQLHGDESLAYCENLTSAGVHVIKVFRVDETFDFAETKPFESVADFFLFDTRGKLYGGNAVPFDWKLLDKYSQSVPFFLSGGIQPHNIPAIKELSSWNIHAIDVNSGVEDQPGIKNTGKISAIINQLSQ